MPEDQYADARLAAAEFAMREASLSGGTVSHSRLTEFIFGGQALSIVEMRGGRGIRKPAGWSSPLSIRTTLDNSYDDATTADGSLFYSYQLNSGNNPENAYNRALREALRLRLPLLHLWETTPGYYLPTWPVFVVEDLPNEYAVVVDLEHRGERLLAGADEEAPDREYVDVTQRRRVHQAKFRDTVLRAYTERCCICALKRRGLLDAAHIIPDAEVAGLPRVSNGLALCKIHHPAYDQLLFGISPDYVVEFREDVLDEVDGPMLRHGLQAFHGQQLTLPEREQDRPDREALAYRYERFRAG